MSDRMDCMKAHIDDFENYMHVFVSTAVSNNHYS